MKMMRVAGCFETTITMASYLERRMTAGMKPLELPIQVKRMGGVPIESRTFPRYQPELDHPEFKRHFNLFESTALASYKDPQLMKSVESSVMPSFKDPQLMRSFESSTMASCKDPQLMKSATQQ